MEQQQAVATFVKDTRFEGFLLVRAAEQRVAGNGSRYLDMTLADRTGEVNAKLWDGAFAPPKVGGAVKVRAGIIEYNGRLQMRVERMRAPQESDQVDISLLTPCAPYPPEEMRARIDAAVAGMQNETLKALTSELLAMAGEALAYFPAAQKLHHAERSGLLHHTSTMLRGADAILAVYPWLDGDLLRAGVIAHDLSKLAEMQSDEAGNVSDYTATGLLLGHLVHGVAKLHEAAARLGLENEEYTLLLEHMIISHHGEAEYGSPRPPMFPEAEMLHWLDVLDARMNEMQGILRRVPAGAFSERIWSLERRVYHPHYAQDAGEASEERQQKEAPNGSEPKEALKGSKRPEPKETPKGLKGPELKEAPTEPKGPAPKEAPKGPRMRAEDAEREYQRLL